MSNTIQTHKYMEIYNALRNLIILKKVPDNYLLPTETELMKEYGAGRNTVRKALKQLQEEGYITTRRGSGSVVHLENTALNTREGRATWVGSSINVEYYLPDPKISVQDSPRAVDQVIAPINVSTVFGLDPTASVYRMQGIWTINNIPYNYMIRYINPVLMPDYEKHMDKNERFKLIASKYYGINPKKAEEHITCCKASLIEAKILDVAVGDALLYTYRIGYCDKGAYEYAIFYGNPAYSGYKIVIG